MRRHETPGNVELPAVAEGADAGNGGILGGGAGIDAILGEDSLLEGESGNVDDRKLVDGFFRIRFGIRCLLGVLGLGVLLFGGSGFVVFVPLLFKLFLHFFFYFFLFFFFFHHFYVVFLVLFLHRYFVR